MGTHHSRLPELFRLYYHNLASDREIEELKTLIREAKDDTQLLHLIDHAWNELHEEEKIIDPEKSSEMLTSILGTNFGEEDQENRIFAEEDAYTEKARPLWYRYIAAACIVVLGLGLTWSVWKNAKKPATQAQVAQAGLIAPAGNKAILTLADGSHIALDQAAEGVLAVQGETEINKSKDGTIVYNAGKEHETGENQGLNTISTPRGGRYEIVLPDGTKAWLNTASSLTFPAAFRKNERNVSIQGEVFFEVVHDRSRPFKVAFTGGEVKVLGTSFNVRNYQDEDISRTTLVEGSVELTNARGSSRLIPGEQASIDKGGTINKSLANMEEVVAWKNGVFYFEEAGIQTVMKEVGRWYDVDVRFEGDPTVRRFSGKVSRDASISELMNILNYIGVKYRIEGRNITITR